MPMASISLHVVAVAATTAMAMPPAAAFAATAGEISA